MLQADSPNPLALSATKRWLYSWWPSRRLGIDPQQEVKIDGRYAPVSIANWKLIGPVARELISRRCLHPLTLDARKKLTVVIPFRDRESHLAQLLPVLRSQLESQGIEHRVLVVEQGNSALFNRGRLLNIGVHFSADRTDYYCLHDADAIPICADYRWPSQPLRLVHIVESSQKVSRRPDHYFSWAVSIRKEQYLAANGFSNEYWGWGKEDDDFFFRLLKAGFLCYYDLEGRFQDLPNPASQETHRHDKVAQRSVEENRKRRSRLLRGLDNPAEDGLSTLNYSVLSHVQNELHEKITVTW